MNKKTLLAKFIVIALILGSYTSAVADTDVTDLICEYHINPIGLDVQKPWLSWKIISDKENLMQSAYQMLKQGLH